MLLTILVSRHAGESYTDIRRKTLVYGFVSLQIFDLMLTIGSLVMEVWQVQNATGKLHFR